MIGVAAANNGKAKEAADLAAELVHMGWGDLVSHTFNGMSCVCPTDMSWPKLVKFFFFFFFFILALYACVSAWQTPCPAPFQMFWWLQ